MTQKYQVKVSMKQAAIVETGIVLKQGDFGMQIEIEVLDFDATGTTPQIVFRKAMGAVESTTITVSNNKYTYTFKGTELDTPGKVFCDLKLKNSTTQRISTASFMFKVVADTLDGLAEESSSYSDTIEQIVGGFQGELDYLKNSSDSDVPYVRGIKILQNAEANEIKGANCIKNIYCIGDASVFDGYRIKVIANASSYNHVVYFIDSNGNTITTRYDSTTGENFKISSEKGDSIHIQVDWDAYGSSFWINRVDYAGCHVGVDIDNLLSFSVGKYIEAIIKESKTRQYINGFFLREGASNFWQIDTYNLIKESYYEGDPTNFEGLRIVLIANYSTYNHRIDLMDSSGNRYYMSYDSTSGLNHYTKNGAKIYIRFEWDNYSTTLAMVNLSAYSNAWIECAGDGFVFSAVKKNIADIAATNDAINETRKDMGVIPISFYKSGATKTALADSVQEENGETIVTCNAKDTLTTPANFIGFVIPKNKILGENLIFDSITFKWGNGDIKNVLSYLKIFVNNTFTYDGARYLSVGTEYNVSTIFEGYEESASIWCLVVLSDTFDTTHLYQLQNNNWHIDACTITVSGCVYDDNSYLWAALNKEIDLSAIPVTICKAGAESQALTNSITEENGETIVTCNEKDNIVNPANFISFSISRNKIENLGIAFNDVSFEWENGDTKDIRSTIKIFVNNSFTYTGARYLNLGTKYDVNTLFDGYNQNAALWFALPLSSSFDTTHLYQLPNENWHIDECFITIAGCVYNGDSYLGASLNDIEERLEDCEQAIGSTRYITCWGDSLTAGGGWTTELETLTGLTVHNCGIGGEPIEAISARQGADSYIIEGVTIPADTSEITLATFSEGFKTQMGNSGIKPLLQGGSDAFNPCLVGDVEGTLRWTGSTYSDPNGTWAFKRTTSGTAETLTRPETIKTKSDKEWNSPYLMVIFMGQNNFGYNNLNPITTPISQENIEKDIKYTRWMINHAKESNYIVLGLATGTAESNALYEQMMKAEFGRYFISLREYLAHPVYNNGDIVNCWGLQDLGLSATSDDLADIAIGKVPSRCFLDGVHFVTDLRPLIGDYIYKRCTELDIF